MSETTGATNEQIAADDPLLTLTMQESRWKRALDAMRRQTTSPGLADLIEWELSPLRQKQNRIVGPGVELFVRCPACDGDGCGRGHAHAGRTGCRCAQTETAAVVSGRDMQRRIREASAEDILYAALATYDVSWLSWPIRTTETVAQIADYAIRLMARQSGLSESEIRRRLRLIDNMAIRRVVRR